MPDTKFGCLPTIIGTMPHTDPEAACSQILHYLKDIPAWPQLPGRSYKENMNVQFSEGFPGAVARDNGILIDRSLDLQTPLEKLYRAYLENDASQFPVSPDYAAGLHTFLTIPNLSPLAVKGQITGPVTWGLTVTDNDGRPIMYDDILGDAVPKFLRLKAAWQEQELRRISPNTIIFVDEPYMASFGSVAMNLSKEKVVSLLDEVFGGVSGLKGVHCCGNTDWSVLLETSVDIVSFDAYNYAESLSLYSDDVKDFVSNAGAIAWGIVPNSEEALARESAASLKDRLEEAMAPFTRDGIRFRELLERGLLTPSCGLANMKEETAARVLELLAELSEMIRKRYV